jgi:nitrogen fixation/metabolism regulation signal transduction histidine kinase
LAFQANIAARDEIAVLVDSFNKMIRDLRDSREKLLASERLAAWREVARQVSHEIKNPLTPIHLALHRLRARFEKIDADPEVVKESFRSIDEELAALGRLAEEFSAFARLPEPKPEPTDLNELIRSTARLYENAPERMILHLDLYENLPSKMLDRDQMRRVLTNLLKNAAEATRPAQKKCEVTLRTRIQNECMVLEVSDNGAGLSEESRQKIFQPNFTTKREGAGLGLAMVKRIIEQHGGNIEVTSEAGKGTRFRILL